MFSKVYLRAGEKQLMWFKKLQIAIIEKNTDNIDTLVQNIPEYNDAKDIESAMHLLKEAARLMYTLKDETSESLGKIKKTRDFLNSTHSKDSSLFNSKV